MKMCTSPITAWQHKNYKNENGKTPLVFRRPNHEENYTQIKVACGNCLSCRFKRSLQWAFRVESELRYYKESIFLTLTYSPEKRPEGGNLNYKDVQLFIKKLRKKYPEKSGENKIMYLCCGEYGKHKEVAPGLYNMGHPHYHMILLNYKPTDLKLRKWINEEQQYYTSEEISSLWQKGFILVGNASYQSAAYVARYTVKKVSGKNKLTKAIDGKSIEYDNADDYYTNIDVNTGEVFNLRHEFVAVSKGLGKKFFDQYKKEIYVHDGVYHKGRKIQPPKYYDMKMEEIDEEIMKIIKEERVKKAVKFAKTIEQMRQQKEIDEIHEKMLVRDL